MEKTYFFNVKRIYDSNSFYDEDIILNPNQKTKANKTVFASTAKTKEQAINNIKFKYGFKNHFEGDGEVTYKFIEIVQPKKTIIE